MKLLKFNPCPYIMYYLNLNTFIRTVGTSVMRNKYTNNMHHNDMHNMHDGSVCTLIYILFLYLKQVL